MYLTVAAAGVASRDAVAAENRWREGEIVVKFRDAGDPKIDRRTPRAKLALAQFPPAIRAADRAHRLISLRPLLRRRGIPRRGRAVTPLVESPRGWYLLQFEDANMDVEAASRNLVQDPGIESAEPNHLLYPNFVPNDPYFSSSGSWGQTYDDQWGLKLTQVPSAWDLVTGTNEIVVAVVDSGLDFDHPDIAANVWTNRAEVPGNGTDDDGNGLIDDVAGWNFLDDTSDATDDSGHGTIGAGIVAAVFDNATGMAGIGRHTKVMALKFLPASGGGSAADAADAINYAASKGADVVNMSFAGDYSAVEEAAINHAHGLGVVLVAGAGNDSSGTAVVYPANFRDVIAVGAADHRDVLADFSNFGPRIDVVAPGGDSGGPGVGDTILSLRAAGTTRGTPLNSQYIRNRGTSFSCPFVAGLAALMLTQRPTLGNEEIRQILRSTADDVMDPGWDLQTTHGRVNALSALQKDSGLSTLVTSPAIGGFVGGKTVIRGFAYGAGFASYKVEFGAGGLPSTWTVVTNSTTAVTNGILASWATTGVPDGPYTIRLTSVEAGGAGYEDRVPVTVSNFDPPAHGGWPVSPGINYGPPIAADLNGDAQMEVLWGAKDTLNIRRQNGAVFPNWPRTNLYSPAGPPTVGDLDGDGIPEIGLLTRDIVSRLGQASIWHADGTAVTGWPKDLISGSQYVAYDAPLVFADVDDNGAKEIIYCSSTATNGGAAILHVDRCDGVPFAGWPVTLPVNQGIFSAPAVADVDGDTRMDIAVITHSNRVFLFHHDGTLFSGWPVTLGSGSSISASPAFADVNRDGILECVAETYGGTVAVYNSAGVRLSGWPKTAGSYPRPPSFADLDGDGKPEILFGNQAGDLHVFRSDGNEFPGWPKALPARVYSVAVADVDNDNNLDLVATDGNRTVHAWDTAGDYLYSLGFPIQVTNASFGCYSAPVVGDMDDDGLLEVLAIGTSASVNLWDLSSAMNSSRMPYPTPMGNNLHQSRYAPKPVLNGVTQNYVTTNSSVQIVITGDFLLKGMKVWLGTNALSVVTNSAGSVTVNITNPSPLGWLSLTATNVNSGCASLSNAIAVVSSLAGDDDIDRLPNGWELENNLDPFDNGSVSVLNGPDGDLDRDEISNLLEYALNLNPGIADRGGLPVVAIQTNPADGKRCLTLSYRRRIASNGLEYVVEVSTNLVTWTNGGGDVEEILPAITNPDGITETATVRIKPAVDTPEAGVKFARLRVTAP